MDFIGHELLVCCYHQGHRIFQSWIDEKSNRLYLLLCWWEHANRCKMGPNIFLSSLKSHSKNNLFEHFFERHISKNNVDFWAILHKSFQIFENEHYLFPTPIFPNICKTALVSVQFPNGNPKISSLWWFEKRACQKIYLLLFLYFKNVS